MDNYNIHTITKEQLIKLITKSKSFNDVVATLNTNKKELYRKRKKFNIINVECNKQYSNREVNEEFENIPLVNKILDDEPVLDRMNRLYPKKLNNDIKKQVEENAKFEDLKLKKNYIKPIIHSQSLLDYKEVDHFIVSDLQISLNTDYQYLKSIALEIIERKPSKIIFLGDGADMKSLYNIRKDEFDGIKYKKDVECFVNAMKFFFSFLNKEFNEQWKPELIYCLGNHEERIIRLCNNYKALNGLIGIADLKLEEFGFKVVPFLVPIVVDNIAYCHYFVHGAMNAPIPNAKVMLQKKLMTCVQGHKQSFEIHREVKANGDPIYGIIAGSSYLHDEEYLGPQGNSYARIVWSLNDVLGKHFSPEMIDINRLVRKWNCKT